MKPHAQIVILILSFAFASVANAQFSTNFQTITISGSSEVWTNGDYVVGGGYHHNDLALLNGASLTLIQSQGHPSPPNLIVSFSAQANSNSVSVVGDGAELMIENSAIIGHSGQHNRVELLNGGRIESPNCLIIGMWDGADNNSVMIGGSNSLWRAGNIWVGDKGDNNSLTVNDGAILDGSIVLGGWAFSSGQNFAVHGSTTVWTNATSLTLTSPNSSALISGGVKVHTGGFVSGATISIGAAATNSIVEFDGAGTCWSNRIYGVDVAGPGSHLAIRNGAYLGDFGASATVNSYGTASALEVVGSGSTFSASSLYIGNNNPDSAGGSVHVQNGGLIQSSVTEMISASIAQPSRLQIDGGASQFVGNHVVVGKATGKENHLIVGNGASAGFSGSIVVGESAGGYSNRVLVSGSGSKLSADNVTVGYSADLNSLEISSDANVFITNSIVVGADGLVCSNSVTITGGQLFVTNSLQNAVCEIRAGSLRIESGTLAANKLIISNTCARLIWSGGNIVYDELILAPSGDIDGDGMHNGWEQSYGLDPLDSDGAGDDDSDGFTNFQEYLAETNPSDPKSTPLRITGLVQEGNNLRIIWETLGGTSNFVQSTASNLGGGFSDLSAAIIAAGTNVTLTNYLHVGGATNGLEKYYRIRFAP